MASAGKAGAAARIVRLCAVLCRCASKNEEFWNHPRQVERPIFWVQLLFWRMILRAQDCFHSKKERIDERTRIEMKAFFPTCFSATWMMRVSLAALLAVSVAGCKSKQDAAIEQAKQKAVQTGQEQQVVSTDKNGNTVTTTVEPPQPGQSGQVVTTTVTPKATTSPASATAPVTTPDSGGATAATTPAPAAAASATATTPPPPPPTVHVAAGTALVIRIDQRLSAKGSRPGERFTGEIHEPVYRRRSQGDCDVPGGSPVRGRVDAAQGRGNFKGAADIEAARLTSRDAERQGVPAGYA